MRDPATAWFDRPASGRVGRGTSHVWVYGTCAFCPSMARPRFPLPAGTYNPPLSKPEQGTIPRCPMCGRWCLSAAKAGDLIKAGRDHGVPAPDGPCSARSRSTTSVLVAPNCMAAEAMCTPIPLVTNCFRAVARCGPSRECCASGPLTIEYALIHFDPDDDIVRAASHIRDHFDYAERMLMQCVLSADG